MRRGVADRVSPHGGSTIHRHSNPTGWSPRVVSLEGNTMNASTSASSARRRSTGRRMTPTRCIVLAVTAGLVVHAPPAALAAPAAQAASAPDTHPQVVLTGRVTSTAEGPLEGVVVTAKRDGSTIAVSVVSDAEGRYRFPAARLRAGRHALGIRAVGFELDGPHAVEVGAAGTTTADLALRTTRDLEAQLTNAEWLESIPGTAGQQRLFESCVRCHTPPALLPSGAPFPPGRQAVATGSSWCSSSVPAGPGRPMRYGAPPRCSSRPSASGRRRPPAPEPLPPSP